MAKRVSGIDVSKYQGDVDFDRVKKAGYDFAIIRAGYGKLISQKDPYFEKNYQNATAAGLDVGAYWYTYAEDAAQARQEAAVCLQAIAGKRFAYPIFFDLENASVLAQGKAACSDMVSAFCDALEQAGYFAGLYISRSPLETNITQRVAKRYALWIAEYRDKCTYTGSYGMWQYTNTGSVSGVSGNVDCNYAYVDYPSIIKRGGFNGFAAAASAKLTKGAKVTLQDAMLYTSADADSGTKLSGTYYLYDGQVVRGRMRITNRAENVGKTPIGAYVTGWVNRSDLLG